MEHAGHAVLMLATAIFVLFGGVVVLALGWRRAWRGERTGLVLGGLTGRQTVVSYLGAPAVGLAGILLVTLVAAALR